MAKYNDEITRLVPQFGHVLTWVGTDSARAEAVRRVLQNLVAGNHPVAPVAVPALSARLQKQVDKVTAFLGVYGGGQPGFRSEDIPAPLVGVPEDVQLLAVYLPDHDGVSGFFRTLDAWFDFAARERSTWRNPELQSDSTVMRLRGEYRPGVRWVRFVKDSYEGRSTTYSRQRSGDLAGLEPLMAASLIDGYVDSWFRDGNVAPNLSAIEVSLDGGKSWDCVAYLDRWFDGLLGLNVRSAGNASPHWGSPRVTEC